MAYAGSFDWLEQTLPSLLKTVTIAPATTVLSVVPTVPERIVAEASTGKRVEINIAESSVLFFIMTFLRVGQEIKLVQANLFPSRMLTAVIYLSFDCLTGPGKNIFVVF